MIQTQDANKVIEELEKTLHSIKNNVFQRATNEIKVRVIISNLDEEERKDFANIPDIYNKDFGTQTKDEVELLRKFTKTIEQKDIQSLIDDHMKAVNDAKENLKACLGKIHNEQFTNLNDYDKISCILNSLKEEERKNFKDIQSIFNKQWDRTTDKEVVLLNKFTEAHIDNKTPWCSLRDCNCLKSCGF